MAWHAVESNTPDHEQDILVNVVDFFGSAIVEIGYFHPTAKVFLTGDESLDAQTYITHWMELPKPIHAQHD